MQRSLCNDIHFPAKQILQVLLQSHVIYEAPPLFHVYKEVEVAIGPLLPASSRAKKPQVLRSVLAGEA
jgi:hypothetical protein